jgi:hypothetical protein
MTAEEIYESVTNGGSSDFAQVAEILDRTGRWCLIGGLAVNCYVEPVYTIDADIVLALENLPGVRENLAAAGFRFEEFAHSLNASKPGSKLQIQFTQDARYQDFIDRAERRDVLGNAIPVAKLEDIMQGKIWAWEDSERRPTKRKKDELDLMRIAEAFPELRHLIPNDIVSQLGGA